MRIIVVDSISDDIYTQINSFQDLTIYHTREWHYFLSQTFGWQIKALLGYSATNALTFFLPFVNKYRLWHRKNVALPLSHHIGLAYDPEQFGELKRKGIVLPAQLGNLEVHAEANLQTAQKIYQNDITILDLSVFETEEQLYSSLDYKSIRYCIDRANKHDIKVINDVSDKTLEDLYKLVAETRHRQGSPLYPNTLFKNLREAFATRDCLSVYVGYYESKPVSGAVFLHFQNTTIYAYSASVSDKRIKRIGTNELIMWKAIQEAFRRNNYIFDFGTSPTILPGLRAYKEKWGGVSHPLYYTHWSLTPGTNPIARNSEAIRFISKLLAALPLSVFIRFTPIIFRAVC